MSNFSNIMSNMSNMSNFSSSSYTTISSSSNSTSGGQSTGQSYISHSTSGPDGTTTRTTSQKMGEPAIEETRHYDNSGRELLNAPAASGLNQNRIQDVEVEDVTDETDADRKYRDAMEDEYAKREGGA